MCTAIHKISVVLPVPPGAISAATSQYSMNSTMQSGVKRGLRSIRLLRSAEAFASRCRGTPLGSSARPKLVSSRPAKAPARHTPSRASALAVRSCGHPAQSQRARRVSGRSALAARAYTPYRPCRQPMEVARPRVGRRVQECETRHYAAPLLDRIHGGFGNEGSISPRRLAVVDRSRRGGPASRRVT